VIHEKEVAFTIGELKKILESYPDDGEVWIGTGWCVSCFVDEILPLNEKNENDRDIILSNSWYNSFQWKRVVDKNE